MHSQRKRTLDDRALDDSSRRMKVYVSDKVPERQSRMVHVLVKNQRNFEVLLYSLFQQRKRLKSGVVPHHSSTLEPWCE